MHNQLEHDKKLNANQTRFEEKKHYVIYDFDSFIADVGGYMGPGCSWDNSIFEMAAKALKMVTKKR